MHMINKEPMTLIFKENKDEIEYISMKNPILEYNLILIETKLPELIAYVVSIVEKKNIHSIRKIIDILDYENPMNFHSLNRHYLYEHKIRIMINALLFGMNGDEHYISDEYFWVGHEQADRLDEIISRSTIEITRRSTEKDTFEVDVTIKSTGDIEGYSIYVYRAPVHLSIDNLLINQ